MLPVEVRLKSLKFTAQNEMAIEEYAQAMIQELENLDQERIDAYNQMEAQKRAVTRAYNKIVRSKSLAEEKLVWNVVLPIGTKGKRFEKWLPRWKLRSMYHRPSVKKRNVSTMGSRRRTTCHAHQQTIP